MMGTGATDTTEPKIGAEADRPLSEEFQRLREMGAVEGLSVGEILKTLERRGYALLAFFLILPCMQPTPIPLSLPFGLATAFVGFNMALARKPWLPQWLLRRRLPPRVIRSVCNFAEKVLKFFERFIKPRGKFFHSHPWMMRLNGALIGLSGFLVAIPMPLPFTNILPTFPVLLLSLGSLEKDGYVILLGYVALGATIIYLLAWIQPLAYLLSRLIS